MSYWHGKRVCVTGGGGFLGYHLVNQLAAAGARVRAFCLTPRPGHPLLDRPDVDKLFGDITDRELTAHAVADCDVVFHTAAIVTTWGPSPARMDAVNIEGTRHVIEAAPGRVVHTSSVVAIGATGEGRVLNEEHPFNLQNIGVDYVRTKRASEELALGMNRDVVVINPGYIIGPDDFEGSVMTRLFHRYWRGRLPALPPGGYSLVDVRDVARGHLLAAEHGIAGRRYILAGENLDWPALASRLAAVAGFRPRFALRLPVWALKGMAYLAEKRATKTGREPYPSRQQIRVQQYRWFFDSSRARAELGYTTRPIDETLREMFECHRAVNEAPLKGLNRWFFRPAGGMSHSSPCRKAGMSR